MWLVRDWESVLVATSIFAGSSFGDGGPVVVSGSQFRGVCIS